MKKTVTINLDKTIFNIDDDAYELLDAYLRSLNEHFAHEEGGQEILNDIESRIAELFKERLGFGMQVITRQEVTEVIAIMGRPDEIETPLEGEAPDDGEISGETASASSPADENNSNSNNGNTPEPERRSRRLYRDPDNRVLGGVASGIAYYIGIDVVLVRVILVLLLPLWASSIWVYLLLWICVPEARTTAQKLEMRGETPTVDNIRRAVEEEHTSGQSTGSSLNSTAGEIFRSIFKIFFIVIGGIIAISIIATLVACIVSLLGLFFLGTTTITTPFISIFPGNIEALDGHWELMLFTVSLLLTFGIPLYAILRLVLGSIFHWQPQSTALNITLLVLWLLSLAGLFFATFVAFPEHALLII